MSSGQNSFQQNAATSQSVVIVTLTSSQAAGQTQDPVVVTAFSTVSFTPTPTSQTSSPTSSTTASSNTAVPLSQSNGLASGSKIAIAVAVPVGVLAILAVLGVLFWRRRKRRQNTLAQRKEEVDQYSFHPNGEESTRTSAIPVSGSYGAGPAAYRGWQPTGRQSLANTGPVPLAAGATAAGLTGAAALAHRHNEPDERPLEAPTLPSFEDDLDSVHGGGYSPTQTYNTIPPRSQTSPGNGSPPLDALSPEAIVQDHSGAGFADEGNTSSSSQRAPYPTGNMSAFMPPLQRGSQRTPSVQRIPSASDARRFSYTNF